MQARLNPKYSHACLPAGVDILANTRCWLKHRVTPSKGKKQLLRSKGINLADLHLHFRYIKKHEVTESDGSCTHSRIVIDATSDLGSLSVSESFLSLNSISFLPFSTLAHLGSA